MTTAHEPRRGPGTHLSADDLSAVAEGAQPSAAGAAEHLLECAACRGEVDAISELLARFEEWDAPALPREVAIRIDAALARESAARAAGDAEYAAAAAASVAALDDGAHELSASSRSTSSSTTAPSASASDGSASGASTHSRRRRWLPTRGLAWGLAGLVVVAGGVGLALNLVSSGVQVSATSNGAASAGRAPLAAPNTESYGPFNGTQVAPDSQLALWTKQALSNHASKLGTAINSPCLSDPAFNGSQALATADGTYEGVASTLVVYANPGDPATVLSVVYATPCSTAKYRMLAKSLVAK